MKASRKNTINLNAKSIFKFIKSVSASGAFAQTDPTTSTTITVSYLV